MKYYKVTRKSGVGIYQLTPPRPIGLIEESHLNTDESKLCVCGIYYCEASQLPLWWGTDNPENLEIREVKILGDDVKVSKGYRTNKLEHLRILEPKEIENLGKEHKFNWFERTQKAGDGSTQTAGNGSTQTAGYGSTQKAGDGSTQTAGNGSTQTAGYGSTQKAGYGSTQKAGDGSTQTAGYGSIQIIYGTESYVILDGENVVLRQVCNGKSWIVNHNDLLKEYSRGTKLRIVKSEAIEIDEKQV
jgi:hypothetical protein